MDYYPFTAEEIDQIFDALRKSVEFDDVSTTSEMLFAQDGAYNLMKDRLDLVFSQANRASESK